MKEPILGIDLGTTNSLVAVVEDAGPRILKNAEGKNLVPSVVHFKENEEVVVGDLAKEKKSTDPKRTVYSVKRLLGKGSADVASFRHELPYDLDESGQSNVRIKVDGKFHTPIEISSMILKEIRLIAQKALQRPCVDAVITVPAYFNDSQRQATRAAGRLAGFNVLRILNEPTAAALAFGLHHRKNGLIAVYDLGGGTFDISILKLKDGIFEVLSTNGNTKLGGDDIDLLLASYFTSNFKLKTDPSTQALLLNTCEKLKIKLATETSAKEGGLELNRSVFDRLVLPLLEKTRVPVENALCDAGLKPADLTDVILVGGPTRLPVLQSFVEKLFGRKPDLSLNPDEVVALGAAIQADILAGNNKDFLLLDVVPLSLGIETLGGAMNRLIPRNTRIPAMAMERFTTYVEGQTRVAINVYQGERELVAENRKLAEFVLSGIPPLLAGTPQVDVTFLVDADGILNVTAKEIHSQIEQSIHVKPSYGLTDEDIEKMLAAGLEQP